MIHLIRATKQWLVLFHRVEFLSKQLDRQQFSRRHSFHKRIFWNKPKVLYEVHYQQLFEHDLKRKKKKFVDKSTIFLRKTNLCNIQNSIITIYKKQIWFIIFK